jgi:hypothetical protein
MGAYSNRLAWETLRTFDTSTLTGSYQTIGLPLVWPSYILKMVNNSNVLVTVSIDGATDIDVLPSNSFFLYDEATSVNPFPEAVPKGTQFFIKGGTPGVGLIYLTTQYIVQT